MLAELSQLLEAVPAEAPREAYAEAVLEQNALGKRTASTRRLTYQRLSELYGLDTSIPMFRVLRRLWLTDTLSRPQLAHLCALARDPLLRATAPVVLSMHPGQELSRQAMTAAVRGAVGERLNDSILDKVVRNASSSWAQSGHLAGRTRKIRRGVVARPVSTTYALALGYLLGLRGTRLLQSLWASALDTSPEGLQGLAADAKRQGLLDLKISDGIIEVHFPQLLTTSERRESHGAH